MHDHPAQSALHASDSAMGWVVLIVPLVVLAAYLAMAARQHRRGRSWHGWRSTSFVVGVGLSAAAVLPPVMQLAHGDLRWHMAQHLAIGMFAPLGLVLAAPLTLLFRSVPVDVGRAISSLFRRRPIHLISHPVTALVLNIGGMYVLYLTPLFAWSLERPALHWTILAHFFAAGCLFTWAIAGPDPAPRRPSVTTRTVVLILSLGLHSFLGKVMYARLLPNDVPFGEDDIREAAMLMYYGGDVAEALLAIALFGSWSRHRERRRQRAADSFSPAPSSSW